MSCHLKAEKTNSGILSFIRRFLYLGLIAMVVFQIQSCNTFKIKEIQEDRRVKASQRKIQKEKDDRDAEYRKQASRQMKAQDKATRKRMKELEKKSRRWQANKPEPFYERWYYNWRERRDNRRQQRTE